MAEKVDWCLKKAKKELQESKKHRGLVKIAPNIDLAVKHIDKADHNLNAALFFRKNGYSDWSANALFYSMYHCFLAILAQFGYESRNQECTLAVIEMLKEEGKIKIDQKFLDMLNLTKAKKKDHSIITIREEFQYGTAIEYKEIKEFRELVTLCSNLIDVTKGIVQ